MLSTENQAGVTERAQRAEANKHTAPVCEEHGVQFAVCGCEVAAGPEGEDD